MVINASLQDRGDRSIRVTVHRGRAGFQAVWLAEPSQRQHTCDEAYASELEATLCALVDISEKHPEPIDGWIYLPDHPTTTSPRLRLTD